MKKQCFNCFLSFDYFVCFFYQAFLVSKGRKLANLNIETCASDGYCQEYEKCCPNYCDEKHTCMASVFDGKEKTSKSKFAKED